MRRVYLLTLLLSKESELPAVWADISEDDQELLWPEELSDIEDFTFSNMVASSSKWPLSAGLFFGKAKIEGWNVEVDYGLTIPKDKTTPAFIDDLLAFFADRLKVHLREQGARHDLIDAVFSVGGQDDLLMIVRRVEALGRFLETEDGANLLAGVKRAINIVRIEEKRDATSYDAPPDRQLLVQGEETRARHRHRPGRGPGENGGRGGRLRGGHARHRQAARAHRPFLRPRDRQCRGPSFRENRLKLLNRIRAATLTVADFSRIEG
jgi:hypothetical protein